MRLCSAGALFRQPNPFIEGLWLRQVGPAKARISIDGRVVSRSCKFPKMPHRGLTATPLSFIFTKWRRRRGRVRGSAGAGDKCKKANVLYDQLRSDRNRSKDDAGRLSQYGAAALTLHQKLTTIHRLGWRATGNPIRKSVPSVDDDRYVWPNHYHIACSVSGVGDSWDWCASVVDERENGANCLEWYVRSGQLQ